MAENCVHEIVQSHLETFFAGHAVEYFTWELGPTKTALPEFRVARFAPGPRSNLWVYASIGAAVTTHDDAGRVEFVLTCPHETPRAVELLAMFAHRHIFDPLGKWHLMPVGEPWLDDSTCDVFLISLPYPFGPDLEICNLPDDHIHILWLLPITQAEREYCKQHGADALEAKFDDAGLEYWKLDRASVV
ncbi:MAG: suppressor of fused domain protein [Planctomycetota bacterium]